MDNCWYKKPNILKRFQLLAKRTIILVEIILVNVDQINGLNAKMNLLKNICKVDFLNYRVIWAKVILKPEKLGGKIFEGS